MDKTYNGQRWLIFNYEAMSKLDAIIENNQFTDVGIIVDESHNFLRTTASRTKGLIALAQNPAIASNLDLLLMSGTPVKLG